MTKVGNIASANDSSDQDGEYSHKMSEKSQKEGSSDNHSIANGPIENALGGGDGKSFRNMSKWDCIFALLTNQVGLGVLSLPGVLKVFGIIPGIIAIIGIGAMSWYTAMELNQFYVKHPHVLNVVDMTKVVGGRPLEIVAGIGLLVQVIMTASSASVTLSIAYNTISSHSICTVGFIGVGCLCCWVLCLPRTAKCVAWSGIPCCISICAAALLVAISLGAAGPRGSPHDWKRDVKVVAHPEFREGLNAALKIVYAFSGNINFVSYMAEMIDPVKDFPGALMWFEIVSIGFYILVAVVLYCLAGEYTVSPALGSAVSIVAKIAYGIALPAIFSTGMAFGHTGIKYVYIELMQFIGAKDQITANTAKSWSIWFSIVTGFWTLCFILSNAIPVFDSILSIASATTISWFTFGFSAVFWFNLNQGRYFSNWKQICLFCVNTWLILISLFMNGGGLWSSITELTSIMADPNSDVQGVFACGDNSS